MVVFPKLSKLLYQEDALSAPCQPLDSVTPSPVANGVLEMQNAPFDGKKAPGLFVLGFRRRRGPMTFIDTCTLDVIQRLPGWHGRYFHSPSMTFAHYDFVRGSSIHEHSHPQEEVYEVIEGELEMTIDGVAQVARTGWVAIVPANVRHSVKALTDGRAIIVDYPLRRDSSRRAAAAASSPSPGKGSPGITYLSS